MSLTDEVFQDQGQSLTDAVLAKREELRPAWMEAVGSFGKGMQRGLAGIAGLPVDVATTVLNQLPGVDIQNPIGGSNWLLEQQQSLTGGWQPQGVIGRAAQAIGEQVPAMLAGPVSKAAVNALAARNAARLGQMAKAPGVTNLGEEVKALLPSAAGQATGVAVAREVAPDNPYVEPVLGVVGGLAGAGAQRKLAFEDMARRRLNRAAPIAQTDLNGQSIKNYQRQSTAAVKDMVEAYRDMPEGFKFTNETGRVIRTGLPKTLAETVEALPQAKTYFYKQYNAMQQAAGKKGLSFSGQDIADKIGGLLTKEGITPSELDAAPYIARQVAKYQDPQFQRMSPQQVENEIAAIHARMKAFRQAPNMHDTSNAAVDLKLLGILNGELDSGISQLEGSGYKELRRKYANLKAVEQRLGRAALANLNREAKKGPFSKADAFWLGEIGAAAASGHPEGALLGASVIGLKHGKEWFYNADRNMKELFKNADKILPREKAPVFAPPAEPLAPMEQQVLTTTPSKKGSWQKVEQFSQQFGLTTEEAAKILDAATARKKTYGGQ